MKSLTTIFALLLPLLSLAQDEANVEPSAESQAYHEYRLKTTTPPYGLAKVQALIAKIKAGADDAEALGAKQYLALSLREKFTYTMIHPESYSQNCDAFPMIQDEQKKIAAYLPDVFDEYSWSDRQMDFLVSNRDSVMAIIKESANRSKRLGLNYKRAIVDIEGVEMIPFLVEFYNRDHKDLDILTVLLQLMKYSKYPPFMSSASYGKLYLDESNYGGYLNYLQYNKPNEELIIKRAMDLYNSKH